MRISVTLDEPTAQSLQRRAKARNQSMTRYLAELAQMEAKRQDDELAEEGYRLLAGDTHAFAENAVAIAAEDWR